MLHSTFNMKQVLKSEAKILTTNGYAILPEIYNEGEIQKMETLLNQRKDIFDERNTIYSVRQLLHKVPELSTLISNNKLQQLLHTYFETPYFLTKAIYFNKPKAANWFVGYHQDISISVTKKTTAPGYYSWTYKFGQYGVIPPIHILENIITVRIHLDDTTQENGALRVIPKSHNQGILDAEGFQKLKEKEHICEIERGGVLLMKPLTFHASNRTINNKQRRVIHLEFSSEKLTPPMDWLEYRTNF